jgi:hypothetical protein
MSPKRRKFILKPRRRERMQKIHYAPALTDKPICGEKKWHWVDWNRSAVNCLECLKKLDKLAGKPPLERISSVELKERIKDAESEIRLCKKILFERMKGGKPNGENQKKRLRSRA